MSLNYSTVRQEGRVFSSRSGQVTILPAGAAGARRPPAPGHLTEPMGLRTTARTPDHGAGRRFQLTPSAAVVPQQTGVQAAGLLWLPEQAGIAPRVVCTLTGLGAAADPAVLPTLWLIHDLAVPPDLSPEDLKALPCIGTPAGRPPAYVTAAGTISLAVSPGQFSRRADGTWWLDVPLDAARNRCCHPLVVLGPGALADINASLPSGTAARIFTDLFMRPVTVHPELGLVSHFAQRLVTIVSETMGTQPESYLGLSQFTRAAVTLEGPLRAIPWLQPTPETCCLISAGP